MKASLYVFKRKGRTATTLKPLVHIVVVDQEKGTKYPKNFVCVLPEFFGLPTRHFEKLYGVHAKDAAKKLLCEAFEKETDSEIKLEIERRLRGLEGAENLRAKTNCISNYSTQKQKKHDGRVNEKNNRSQP
jgi:hypothetical protein